MITDYTAIIEYLKANLKERTYQHCIRVSDEAVRIARLYGVDENKARLAGLLHDCAKRADVIELAQVYGVELPQDIINNPHLAHGFVGEVIIKQEFGIDDLEILSAVRKHTVGDDQMSELDKIIYIADYSEPNRDFDGVDDIRNALNISLDEAMIVAIAGTFKYLLSERRFLHPQALRMYNMLIEKGEEG